MFIIWPASIDIANMCCKAGLANFSDLTLCSFVFCLDSAAPVDSDGAVSIGLTRGQFNHVSAHVLPRYLFCICSVPKLHASKWCLQTMSRL